MSLYDILLKESESDVSQERLDIISSHIAAKFKEKLASGEPVKLTDTTISVLKDYNVTKPKFAEEISKVANRKVNDMLYKESANKFFIFELANPEEVKQAISSKPNLPTKEAELPIIDTTNEYEKLLEKQIVDYYGSIKDTEVPEPPKVDREAIKLAEDIETGYTRVYEKTVRDTYNLKSMLNKVAEETIQNLEEGYKLTDIVGAIDTYIDNKEVKSSLIKTAIGYGLSYGLFTVADMENMSKEKIAESYDEDIEYIKSLKELGKFSKNKEAGVAGTVGRTAKGIGRFAPDVLGLAISMPKLKPIKVGPIRQNYFKEI